MVGDQQTELHQRQVRLHLLEICGKIGRNLVISEIIYSTADTDVSVSFLSHNKSPCRVNYASIIYHFILDFLNSFDEVKTFSWIF